MTKNYVLVGIPDKKLLGELLEGGLEMGKFTLPVVIVFPEGKSVRIIVSNKIGDC